MILSIPARCHSLERQARRSAEFPSLLGATHSPILRIEEEFLLL
jgi:hypothetical protein